MITDFLEHCLKQPKFRNVYSAVPAPLLGLVGLGGRCTGSDSALAAALASSDADASLLLGEAGRERDHPKAGGRL